mgnify:CR=1 FL=1
MCGISYGWTVIAVVAYAITICIHRFRWVIWESIASIRNTVAIRISLCGIGFGAVITVVAYTIAIHVPIAGLSLVPVLLGWPLLLLPVHIAALEMIIDPACSLVFEGQPESPHVMRRPPRPTGEPLLTRGLLTLSLLQGLLVLGAGLAVCALALPGGGERARALTFASLVSANIGLIITNLSHRHSALASLRRENVALWWLLAAALTLGLVVFLSSSLQKILSFAPVPLGHLLASAGVGVASVLWFEVWKALRRSPQAASRGSGGAVQA